MTGAPADGPLLDGPPTEASSDLERLLGAWAPQQRWFPSKHGAGRLHLRGTVELAPHGLGGEAPAGDAPAPGAWGDPDAAVVRVHVIELAGGGHGTGGELVQVPLVYRRVAREAAEHALVGRLPEDESGTAWLVYDGPHDPAFTSALLRLLDGGARAAEDGTSSHGELAAGAPAPDPSSPARVLRGEQSNTSIIVEPAEGPPVIIKVFRVLHPGDNPDVVVQGALAAVGCDRIPAPVGWVEGTWPSAGGGDVVAGHLAVASEFLVGAQDAWREATGAVNEGRDFTEQARALGRATGEVHRALATAMPTREVTAADRAALADGLRDRAAWALLSAPVLAASEDALQARLDTADDVVATDDAPVLQRIHGDYHLGQVLHVAGRGWMLLDFEGEPLRPLAERSLPDLALRDVAGMLRSFDYAAASAPPEVADAARAWGDASRAAFCEGYAEATGSDPRAQGRLLDALELDKALYEVVYETRNRPTWVPVPLGAVERLLAG